MLQKKPEQERARNQPQKDREEEFNAAVHSMLEQSINLKLRADYANDIEKSRLEERVSGQRHREKVAKIVRQLLSQDLQLGQVLGSVTEAADESRAEATDRSSKASVLEHQAVHEGATQKAVDDLTKLCQRITRKRGTTDPKSTDWYDAERREALQQAKRRIER